MLLSCYPVYINRNLSLSILFILRRDKIDKTCLNTMKLQPTRIIYFCFTFLCRHPSIIPFAPGDEKSISCLPMVHIAGLMIGMLNPLSQGAATVVLPRFEPESYLKAIQDYRVRNTKINSPCFSMTVSFLFILCKCKKKQKRESKMDNPETLTTLGTRHGQSSDTDNIRHKTWTIQ